MRTIPIISCAGWRGRASFRRAPTRRRFCPAPGVWALRRGHPSPCSVGKRRPDLGPRGEGVEAGREGAAFAVGASGGRVILRFLRRALHRPRTPQLSAAARRDPGDGRRADDRRSLDRSADGRHRPGGAHPVHRREPDHGRSCRGAGCGGPPRGDGGRVSAWAITGIAAPPSDRAARRANRPANAPRPVPDHCRGGEGRGA